MSRFLTIVILSVVFCSCSSITLSLEKKSRLLYPSSLVVSNTSKESLAHGSRFIVYNNDLFIAYYSGRTTTTENIEGTDIEVCISKFSLSQEKVVKRNVVLSKADTIAGYIQSPHDSPYDPALFRIGDDVRIWMVLSPMSNNRLGDRCIGFRDVSLADLTLSDNIQLCKFSYSINNKEFLEDLSMNNLAVFADRLRGKSILSRNMGAYPVLNGIKEQNGRLYTVLSFITSIGNESLSPCLLESLDNGLTWNYLCSLGEEYDLTRFWEVDWAVLDSYLYIVARAVDWDYSPCFVYDISKNTLIDNEFSVFKNDVDDSRPCIFPFNDYLFIIQNVHPRYNDSIRTRVRIIKADESFNVINQNDFVFPDGCSYFSVDQANGRTLMVYSEDYRHRIMASKGDIALTDITEIIKAL